MFTTTVLSEYPQIQRSEAAKRGDASIKLGKDTNK